MKPSIYIPQRELDKLERKTNQILKELSKEKKGILLAAARYIRDGIKQNAPVGPTGNLKKAAYATAYPATMRSPAIAFAGVRPRRAPHAHLVEYGHGGPHPAPAHPFVRPAIDERKGPALDMIEKGLKKTVEGAV